MTGAAEDISIYIMNATTSLVPRTIVEPLEKYALSLGLTKLPAHLPTLVFSFFLFLFVHQVAAPLLSPIIAPTSWSKLRGSRGRNNWCIHIVSEVHALVCVPLAWKALSLSELDKDRAFGWDDRVGTLAAFSTGYFLWDTLDAIVNFEDAGFVAHGIACSAIYMMSFSYNFWGTLLDVKDQTPLVFLFVYGVGNILLNGLNWLWFLKMITALQKRFKKPNGTVSNGTSKKGSKIAKTE
ncbi:hypothetical protein VNI00_003123 [Paramarasmius palmivorus]|uniref:TLC domain-containing protein n=1 Tax=Paramarasmius palmivorus TaxID=297713 RepID=A0AAW0DUD9_9AGAR